MSREKVIQELDTTCGSTIQVKVYYSKGGMNYFTSTDEGRGIYLNVRPVKIIKKEGYTVTEYLAYSGIKKHCKVMMRFNQKVFDNYAPEEELIERMVNHVLDKNKLTLKTEENEENCNN